MKTTKIKSTVVRILILSLLVGTVAPLTTLTAHAADPADSVLVYRMYNPFTGEHFYTTSEAENGNLQLNGWVEEGIGWFGATTGDPVYRVYNPNALGGDHYYTLDLNEANYLVSLGWMMDLGGAPAFYSGGGVDLYEAYNPNAQSGAHNYTTNRGEQNALLSAGWLFDKVAWNVKGVGSTFSFVDRTKGDVDITEVGGGEKYWNTNSFRWIYADRTFDDVDLSGEQAACDFSADVNMNGNTEDYGMQFVIAGTREACGQIGVDLHYQAGFDERYHQNRINFTNINFPADSGIYGQQYYSVNTSAPYFAPGQTVHLQVKYYDSGYMQTYLNGQLMGQYRTKLRHTPEFILHFQASAPTTITNVKVIKYGEDTTHHSNLPFNETSYYVDNGITPISAIY